MSLFALPYSWLFVPALFMECTPIYRLSHIVGIPRLHCAFYRLHKSIESAEHIHQHTNMYVHSITSTTTITTTQCKLQCIPACISAQFACNAHHQCKLQVMSIMSASEVFALITGKNTTSSSCSFIFGTSRSRIQQPNAVAQGQVLVWVCALMQGAIDSNKFCLLILPKSVN